MGFGLRQKMVGRFESNDFHAGHFGWKCHVWIISRQVSGQMINIFSNFYQTSVFYFIRYGRRIPLVAAVLIQLAAGVAAAFIPWFWLYCVARFVLAFATGGTMVTR